MAVKRLTLKQRGFVKDYLETGNATEAVRMNYDLKGKEPSLAGIIASENLNKPKVKEAIEERLSDDLLSKRHQELLNKREVIKAFNGDGILIDQPDTQAVSKALDMAYKIKDKYAPEKHVTVTVSLSDLLKQAKENG